MAGNPWFKFYPSDWRGSTRLKCCSSTARAVLVEMMCIMHEAIPYGHLVIAGKAVSDRELAKQSGLTLKEVATGHQELQDNGVIAVTETGITYSPRMVRDEEVRKRRAAGGRKSVQNPNVPPPKDTLKDTLRGYPSFEDEGPPQIPDARSQSKAVKASVSTKPAIAVVENSERDLTDGDLMGLVRKLFYAPDGKPPTHWDEGREFSIFRALRKAGFSGRTIAARIEGAAAIRDAGGMVRGDMSRVDWLGPGDKMTMRALYHAKSGVLELWQLAEIKLLELNKAARPQLFESGSVKAVLRQALGP